MQHDDNTTLVCPVHGAAGERYSLRAERGARHVVCLPTCVPVCVRVCVRVCLHVCMVVLRSLTRAAPFHSLRSEGVEEGNASKKPRVIWSMDMHQQFVNVSAAGEGALAQRECAHTQKECVHSHCCSNPAKCVQARRERVCVRR